MQNVLSEVCCTVRNGKLENWCITVFIFTLKTKDKVWGFLNCYNGYGFFFFVILRLCYCFPYLDITKVIKVTKCATELNVMCENSTAEIDVMCENSNYLIGMNIATFCNLKLWRKCRILCYVNSSNLCSLLNLS